MLVLGLNENHDSAAALVRDGRLVAAISMERLSRVKHHGHAVSRCVEYVLSMAGAMPQDVDLLVSVGHGSIEPEHGDEYDFICALRSQVKRHFIHASHHELHACHAAFSQPHPDIAVMVYDGMGCEVSPTHPWWDRIATSSSRSRSFDPPLFESESHFRVTDGKHISLMHARLTTHKPYRIEDEEISIGRLYSYASKYMFGHRDDAGKIMALASYADPVAEPAILITPAGPRVDRDFLKRLVPLRGGASEPLAHASIAARIQADVVSTMTTMARRLREETGLSHLCLTGGVALNCPSNAEILRSAGFDSVYVPSAPTDDGIAVGAALFGSHCVLGDTSPDPTANASPYLGRSYSTEEIEAVVEHHHAGEWLVEKVIDFDSLADMVSADLSLQRVVGWFQGRSEFGPRALGNRSILADPRCGWMQDHINVNVKGRESFRPFAPSVLAHRCHEVFDVPAGWSSPYMSFVARVRPEWRERLPAVTHVDGTSRIQTVTREANPRYFRLLQRFAGNTGVPLILNTSFNGPAEPIVETPVEALRTAATTKLDVLILQDFVLRRRT